MFFGNKANIGFGTKIAKICDLSPRYTHGPIVKTGPTAGQNRSRNKDGRWRAKRSDAGKSRD